MDENDEKYDVDELEDDAPAKKNPLTDDDEVEESESAPDEEEPEEDGEELV